MSSRIKPDFEIAALPAILLGPSQGEDHPSGFARLSLDVGKMPGITRIAALRRTDSRPVIHGPHEGEALIRQHVQFFARDHVMPLPVEAKDLDRRGPFAVAISFGNSGDAIKDLSVGHRP